MSIRYKPSLVTTKQEWEELNPVALPGDVLVCEDTGQVKVGDGIHSFNDLPFLGVPTTKPEIAALGKKSTLADVIKALQA